MKHQTFEEAAEHASLYVLGALDDNEARLFEAHLTEGCDTCASEIRSLEPVIIALGAYPAEASPSPKVREKLVAFLHEATQPAAKPTSFTAGSLTQMLKIRAGEGEWNEIAKGVSRKVLFEDRQRGTITSLIKLQPGARIPTHRHKGIEECIVLEGDILSNNESFGSGDYLCAPAGSVHEQLYSTHGALLFIIAAGEATV